MTQVLQFLVLIVLMWAATGLLLFGLAFAQRTLTLYAKHFGTTRIRVLLALILLSGRALLLGPYFVEWQQRRERRGNE